MRHPSSGCDDQGGPSWRVHGPTEPSHSEEGRRSTDDGRHTAYEIPLLTRAFEWPSPEGDEPPAPRSQGRLSVEPAPPLTPSIDPPHGQGSATPHYESRVLRPPLHADSEYGRHHSTPLYGSDDWDRRMTFGQLPPPGEGSSSRVVLPPVSHLLGELGMLDEYERGPVLPQLRLPGEAGMGAAPRMGEEEGERREEGREKRGRVEMGGEEKRPGVRKIYVACDFCRGRKLRCDGGRPRCSNCETRSLMCKYQEHPRRRGPGKAPKGTRGKKGRRKGDEDPDMAGASGVP